MKSDHHEVKKATEALGKKMAEEKSASDKKEAVKATVEHLDQITSQIAKGMSSDKGISPKDVLGLSDQMVEGIYGQAYRLYQTGRYQDAIQLFRLLMMINTVEPKYCLGLAACFHMLKDYKTASDLYTMCSVIDSASPIPHYHASDCYIQMNDSVSAIIALEMAVKRAGNKAEYKMIKERSLITIESLKGELEKKLSNPKT